MGEYIGRNELLKILNDKYVSIADINSLIIDMEPAEVIERAKVNKAIQNIEFEKHYLRHENIELDKMFDKGLDKALEILKRDIGE